MPVDVRGQWSLLTGTLYGFGVITTLGCFIYIFILNLKIFIFYFLGYNRIEPKSLKSRLFCVVYGS